MVRWERAETTAKTPDCRGRFDWALAGRGGGQWSRNICALPAPTGHALLFAAQWSQPRISKSLERGVQPLLSGRRAVRSAANLHSAPWACANAVVLPAPWPLPASYPRPVGVPAQVCHSAVL